MISNSAPNSPSTRTSLFRISPESFSSTSKRCTSVRWGGRLYEGEKCYTPPTPVPEAYGPALKQVPQPRAVM